jgi:hypothetical protein
MEAFKGSLSVSSSEAYAGYSGNSRVHTQVVYAANRIYVVKALGKGLCTWVAAGCDGITYVAGSDIVCCRV